MASSFKSPILQAIDQNGNPVPGAKLFAFASGTTTPVVIYSNQSLTTPLPYPLIANARGYFASAGGIVQNIWWSGQALRLRLTDVDENVIWEIDNYSEVTGAAQLSANNTFTGDNTFTGETVGGSFANLSALTARSIVGIPSGSVAYVDSYGPVAGVGGGQFELRESGAAADGVLVFAPDTAPGNFRWHRINYTQLTPEMAGAAGDMSYGYDGAMTNASTTFEADGIGLLPVGAPVRVRGAAGLHADLITTIATIVGDDEVTLADAATATVSSAEWFAGGTDDTPALRRLGAVLARNGGSVLAREGACYRVYLTGQPDTAIMVATGARLEIDWNWNGATVYGDRNILGDNTVNIFPFQVNGVRRFAMYGARLTTRSRTIASTDIGKGFRWAFVTGNVGAVRWDCLHEYSLEGLLFSGAGECEDVEAIIRAKNSVYGYASSRPYVTRGVRAKVEADGVFRTAFPNGCADGQFDTVSRNALGGDITLTAYAATGGDAAVPINVSVRHRVLPRTSTEVALNNAGRAIQLSWVGEAGASLTADIDLIVDNVGGTQTLEQAVAVYKFLDNGTTRDTTSSRGHIANVKFGRCVVNGSVTADPLDFFAPESRCGAWTGENVNLVVENLTSDTTGTIFVNQRGVGRGPALINWNAPSATVSYDGSGGLATSFYAENVNTSSHKLGINSGAGGITSNSFSYTTDQQIIGQIRSTASGTSNFNIYSTQPGGNLGVGIAFFDKNNGTNDSLSAQIRSVADGRLWIYTRANLAIGSTANVWKFEATGHFEPAVNNTYDIGATGARVRVAYGVKFDASTAGLDDPEYRVNGVKVVGARVINADIADPPALTAQALTDNSGGVASDTIAVIGAIYSQTEVANAIASLADEINKLRADLVEVRAHGGVASNTVIRTHGLGAVS